MRPIIVQKVAKSRVEKRIVNAGRARCPQSFRELRQRPPDQHRSPIPDMPGNHLIRQRLQAAVDQRSIH